MDQRIDQDKKKIIEMIKLLKCMLTGHTIKSNVYRWSKRLLGAQWVTKHSRKRADAIACGRSNDEYTSTKNVKENSPYFYEQIIQFK